MKTVFTPRRIENVETANAVACENPLHTKQTSSEVQYVTILRTSREKRKTRYDDVKQILSNVTVSN